MLGSLARAIKPFVPQSLYRSVQQHIGRRHANRWLKNNGVLDLGLKIAERFSYTVQSGPFKGMKYTRDAVMSRQVAPALIGQYERQIHSYVMAAIARCDLVIDIGHAEGFYAVGIARLGKPVVAFDANHSERRICRGMADVNGVSDLVDIRSWCDGEALASLVKDRRVFILCDIDGGEIDLFTSEVISAIRHCDLVIELHGSADDNERFVDRFRGLFQIEVIDHPQTIAGAEMISFLGPDADRMASEYRTFQQWMIAS